MKGTFQRVEAGSIVLPAEVMTIARRVQAAGFEVYAVGGGVRDSLLGRPVKDWDLATNAKPKDILKLYPKAIPTGIQHGTVTIVSSGKHVEITTYRVEGRYTDSRHPDQVSFVESIEEDLARRDFTINAIALDPLSRQLVDPEKGAHDLKRATLRTVGNPDERFSEDALRLLRAARFSAQLGFSIEPVTLAAMKRRAAQINKIAKERIRAELDQMLLSTNPALAIEILAETDLLRWVLPELEAKLSPLLQRLRSLAARPSNLAVMWCGTLADLNIPTAESILKRLRCSNQLISSVKHLLAMLAVDRRQIASAAQFRRWNMQVGRQAFASICTLLQATDPGYLKTSQLSQNLVNFLERAEEQFANQKVFSSRDLALNGREIMLICRVEQGERVGEILSDLLDLVLEHPNLNERETLTQYLIDTWRDDLD